MENNNKTIDMVVIAKVQLKRQEDRMYQTNYPRW